MDLPDVETLRDKEGFSNKCRNISRPEIRGVVISFQCVVLNEMGFRLCE